LLVQVRVVETHVAEQRLNPDDVTADARRFDACNPTVGRGQHGRAARGKDVHAAMRAPAAVSFGPEAAPDRAAVDALDWKAEQRA
jgi:hypothetical protein